MPPEFFKRLGIAQPPEQGEYFVDLYRYMKDKLKIDAEQRREEIFKDMDQATQRPWTAKQYPHLAGWLEANAHFRRSSYCWAMYLRLLQRYLEQGETVPYADRLGA